MTCNACGDKPKKTCNNFTKAVIEINNPEALVLLRKVVIPASMGDDTDVPATIGKYKNVLLHYDANQHNYLYSSDGIPTLLTASVPQEVLDRITELETDVSVLERGLETEAGARERADGVLQQEIDDLKNSPDVVDIVATYADLMAYDTSSLGDKDVIRVLEDETHDDESTYYRWDKTNSQWDFIGAIEGYYTKEQTDELLDTKQDELTPGENIAIFDESGALVIYANDTTYTAGYGLELNDTEFSVDSSVVQDTLVAGDNISIEDESGSLVISAEDTTYTAGTGLNLTGTEFSIDNSTIPTKTEVEEALDEKQDALTAGENITIEDESGDLVISATDTKYTAGSNVQISSQNVISATDTTYTHFTGATASTDGVQGLVPGPLAGDEDKYLKGDGTWGTVQAGPTVVQTTGTSTTDVMSQNATTSMVYADPATAQKVSIGATTNTGNYTTAVGYQSYILNANRGVALGYRAEVLANGAVAIGTGASATNVGEVNIGSSTSTAYGFNNSNYRLLTGLYDPQSAHDAATKGYVDTGLATKADASALSSYVTNSALSTTLGDYATTASLATVATTGAYSDLSGLPTLPTVGDATITVTNNGTTVGSFTTNATANATIALSAPVITMQASDPGEGVALAENNFIAVYSA